MGATYVVPTIVTNTSEHPVQVDGSLFGATIAGGTPMERVRNDTAPPLTSWAPGFFFCAREVRGAMPFPDHVILQPTQHTSGLLCFVSHSAPDQAAWAQRPPQVALAFGSPEIFRRETHPQGSFMGVFLPASK